MNNKYIVTVVRAHKDLEKVAQLIAARATNQNFLNSTAISEFLGKEMRTVNALFELDGIIQTGPYTNVLRTKDIHNKPILSFWIELHKEYVPPPPVIITKKYQELRPEDTIFENHYFSDISATNIQLVGKFMNLRGRKVKYSDPAYRFWKIIDSV